MPKSLYIKKKKKKKKSKQDMTTDSSGFKYTDAVERKLLKKIRQEGG